ncbi:MAG: hypothetical protein KKA81_14805 [Bacteroidetes bacterium]|nr:hypothetical protein [Bacteroidota bacterium]
MKIVIRYLFIPVILFLLVSCEQDRKKDIVYQVSNNSNGFLVHYRDSNGQLIKNGVDVQSKEDVWKYSFEADEGDIVFVSAKYDNPTDGIRIMILIDGKTYKQGSSLYDTLNFVTVSGTVPFD